MNLKAFFSKSRTTFCSYLINRIAAGILAISLLLIMAGCGYPTPKGGGELNAYVIVVTPTPLPATVTAIADATVLANKPPTPTPTTPPPITNTPAVRPTTASTAPKPTPSLEVVNDSYTVKEGDTLLGIAIRLGVDFDELAALNKIQDRNSIKIGQVLKLPKRQPTATPGA